MSLGALSGSKVLIFLKIMEVASSGSIAGSFVCLCFLSGDGEEEKRLLLLPRRMVTSGIIIKKIIFACFSG